MKNSYQTTGKILQRIAFVVSLWMLFSSGIVVYSQSDTPYIYYYSLEDQAFIMQQADGSERQLLTPYALEEAYEGQMGIWGAGWSSSSNWFTWMSRPAEGGGSYAREAYILQNSDSTLQTIPSEVAIGGIVQTLWSPTQDLLLIVSYDATDVATPIIAVYDPAEEEYVFSYTTPEIPLYPQQIEWSLNGQFVTVSFTNTILLLPVETGTETVMLHAQLPTPSRCSNSTVPHWLTDGRLVYTSSIDELVIANIETGEQISIPLTFGEIELVDWSPDERYALIYTKSEDANHFQLYLLTLADNSISLIFDDVRITNDCTSSHWSDDSRYAVFLTGDEQLQLFSITGDSAEAQNISLESLPTLASQSAPASVFSLQEDTLFLDGLLMNLETREVTELTPSGDLLIDVERTDAVRWHPSGQWLFLLSGSNSLYWVKLASITGSVTPEIALCPLDSQACYGWMP